MDLSPKFVKYSCTILNHYKMKSKITLFFALSLFLSVSMAKATTPSYNQEAAASSLTAVFDNYFLLKDALVKTDAKDAMAKAKELLESVNEVKAASLSKTEQATWLKMNKKIQANVQKMAATADIKGQRALFVVLSSNMQIVLKASKYSQPVYAQFCPMANGGKGASWLSKEKGVKNPYYGNQMLTCGSVTETIK